MTTKFKFSIVICCFNSETRLPTTLDHLANVVKQNIEVLIVDNNSTDNTIVIAENESRYPVKVLQCKKQGLAYAREIGVVNSAGEYIILVDDDNYLSPDYVSIIEQVFANNPDAIAVGGKSTAVFDPGFTAPEWFDEYKSAYAVGPQSQHSGFVDPHREFLFGAGIAVPRKALLRIYQSRIKFANEGRVGKLVLSGDDYELCHLLRFLGGRLYYTDKATFLHYMPQTRLTKPYLNTLFRGFGRVKPILSFYSAHLENGKKIRRSMIFNVVLCVLSSMKKFIKKRNSVSYNELLGCFAGVTDCMAKKSQLLNNIRNAKSGYS